VVAACSKNAAINHLTLIPNELPQFKANYVENHSEESQHAKIPELGLFKLLVSDLVKIISKENNFDMELHLRNLPLSLRKTRHRVPISPAEMSIYLGINIHFGLYPLAVQEDC
jgi:hypothetical protein